jgi:predicted TIM-barrel fold metal-dependent hydrolase
MFPTLASLVEERMRDDPKLIHAVVHSLNQWLDETWSFNYQDRIFTVPVISLPIVDKAIEELEWCVERGAKAILIRPAPVPGFQGSRSFAMPEFDPFWKRVVELDVLVTMHASDSGYSRYTADWEGSQTEKLPFQTNTFRMVSSWRDIQDAVAAWVCHGALFRFPDLKIAVIENGASWLAPLLDILADVYKKAPEGFPGDPVAAIKRSIHVSPFWEEDLAALAELVGVERVLFGSDFPHPEGLAQPARYVEEIKDMPLDAQKLIMGGNLARLMSA